jgi:hypothetical protein
MGNLCCRPLNISVNFECCKKWSLLWEKKSVAKYQSNQQLSGPVKQLPSCSSHLMAPSCHTANAFQWQVMIVQDTIYRGKNSHIDGLCFQTIHKTFLYNSCAPLFLRSVFVTYCLKSVFVGWTVGFCSLFLLYIFTCYFNLNRCLLCFFIFSFLNSCITMK